MVARAWELPEYRWDRVTLGDWMKCKPKVQTLDFTRRRGRGRRADSLSGKKAIIRQSRVGLWPALCTTLITASVAMRVGPDFGWQPAQPLRNDEDMAV